MGDDTWYVWEPYAAGWADRRSALRRRRAGLGAHHQRQRLHAARSAPARGEGDPAALSLKPAGGVLPHRQPHPHGGGGRRAPDPLRARPRQPGAAAVGHHSAARSRARTCCWASKIRRCMPPGAARRRWKSAASRSTGEAVARHLFPERSAGPDAGADARLPGPGSNWRAAFRRRCSKTCASPTKSARTCTPSWRLRAVARARRNIGSFEAGLEEMKDFLAEAGIDAGSVQHPRRLGALAARTW